jgi:hypothetical protein
VEINSPSIIRAQCAADPVRIAREIARAKISAELNATIPDDEARRREFTEWAAKLNSARSVAEIMIVESRAAASYWRTFRDVGLRERKNGNLPRSWLRFAQRKKGAAFLGNQHASHPINAMLNYCYIVEAGRLARALAAHGLALTIGYLHSDKKGRNSLVWDAIEPLRPVIDARVFAFIVKHEFARSRLSAVRLQRASTFARCDATPPAPRLAAVARDRGSGGMDGEDDCVFRRAVSQSQINSIERKRGWPTGGSGTPISAAPRSPQGTHTLTLLLDQSAGRISQCGIKPSQCNIPLSC